MTSKGVGAFESFSRPRLFSKILRLCWLDVVITLIV